MLKELMRFITLFFVTQALIVLALSRLITSALCRHVRIMNVSVRISLRNQCTHHSSMESGSVASRRLQGQVVEVILTQFPRDWVSAVGAEYLHRAELKHGCSVSVVCLVFILMEQLDPFCHWFCLKLEWWFFFSALQLGSGARLCTARLWILAGVDCCCSQWCYTLMWLLLLTVFCGGMGEGTKQCGFYGQWEIVW